MMQIFLENTPECLSQNSLHPIFNLTPYLYSYNSSMEFYLGLESNNTNSDIGNSFDQNTFSPSVVNYDEPISILVDWLETIGWRVKWYKSRGMNDEASVDDKVVTISLRQIPRHQYYSLLHECAHVDLLAGPPKTRRGEPHGYLDLWWGKVNERTLRHRTAVVIDEIAAWEHAIKLAKQLEISIDLEKYRDFRNRNLKTYFAWCLDREDIDWGA